MKIKFFNISLGEFKMTNSKSIFAVFAFVVLLVFAACNEKQINEPVHTGAVSGYFVTEDGNPISSATVEVTDADGKLVYSGITAKNGSFTIENIPQDAENSIVSFSKDSRVLQQLRLKTLMNITGISGKRGDVFLEEDYDYDATCFVKVIDRITQQPLENALIQLGTSPNAMMDFRTDSEGMATLKFISNAHYPFLHITKEGYHIWVRRSNSLENTVTYTFELEQELITYKNTLQVRLVTLAYPILFRKIHITGANGFKDSAITFGPDVEWNYQGASGLGVATFTGLDAGIYKVIFDPVAGDYEKAEIEVQVSGDEINFVNLITSIKQNLCSNNVLIVNLRDMKGNTINCGTAHLKSIIGKYYTDEPVAISSDGRVIFTGISKGEDNYEINIDCIDQADKTYKAQIRGVVFDCNETNTVETTLVVDQDFSKNCCDIFFTVQVYNEFKPFMHPVPDQKMRITGPKDFSASVTTTMNGFTFNDLCNGKYTVTWEKDDGTEETQEINLKCGKWDNIIFYVIK